MRELVLHQTSASGPLLPARFTELFALLAKLGTTPSATMRGQELRLAVGLSLEDDACAGFLLDFLGQGRRVRGTAHGPSAELLEWAFHTLASSLRCGLTDETGREIAIAPEERRARALAYLSGYEAEVRASRKKGGGDDDDGAALLDWLAREEAIALSGPARTLVDEGLRTDDVPALYEQLLESDVVDDVFVSERELGWLLARFRARRHRDGDLPVPH